MQKASPAVRPPTRRPAEPPPAQGWEERYLELLTETGAKVLSAKEIGLRWRDVTRRMREDPDFAEKVEEAIELYADGLEKRLTTEGGKNTVVGIIVRLKALRPEKYIEKQVTLNANINAETDSRVTPEAARELLRDMLRAAQPATVAALFDREPLALPIRNRASNDRPAG